VDQEPDVPQRDLVLWCLSLIEETVSPAKVKEKKIENQT
jgi:hypothetical protein